MQLAVSIQKRTIWIIKITISSSQLTLTEQEINRRIGRDGAGIMDITRPRCYAILKLNIIIKDQMCEQQFYLIAGKETAWTSMCTISYLQLVTILNTILPGLQKLTEIDGIIRSSNELIFVLGSGFFAHIGKTKAIELIWVGPFGAIFVDFACWKCNGHISFELSAV